MTRPLAIFLLAAWCAPLAADDAQRAELAARLPGVEAGDIRESPVAGLYEVTVGASVLYVSADGRHLLNGEIIDLESRANLTEQRMADVRARWVRGLDESGMVIFEPPGRTRHTITVFTDIDCGYCQAMHEDIDGLLARGVRVRYLLYPRTGPGTPSARKAGHVWCSEDRNAALTRAKAGKKVTAAPCDTPVDRNLELAREVRITGTPSTVTEDGHLIPGFLPTAQLIAQLERLQRDGPGE